MIQLSDISFAFDKRSTLFQNLNLSLQSGHTYGLFGLNGAGKTTLLNLISGMLFPAAGSCTFEGESTQKRLPSVMSNLFIVPEQFELPPVKPKEYIEIQQPFYPHFDVAEMERLMKDFIINSDKILTQHSYGQRKKFLIAFAISTNTQLLLMDEPTNGLDIPSKSQFRKVMAQAENRERCTVISTHQVRDLESIIDHITVLHSGQIIFNQPVDRISANLSFKKTEGVSPEVIYSEEIPGGFHTISRPLDNEPQLPVDLELLFNSIIQKTDAINHVFDNA